MKTGLFHSILKIESLAAILFLLTIVLVIAYQTFTRNFTVDAQTANWTTAASDDRIDGGSSFTENLSNANELSFSYRTQDSEQNSFAIFLLSPPAECDYLDLSWFTEITIRARAEGEGKQQFLLYLRDRPAHLVVDNDASDSKYNEAFVELTEQTKSISLPKECFVVPRWWIAEKAVLPDDASPSFSNIEWIEFAVSCPNSANSGVVVIEEISFRGPLIAPVNFYRLLFGIWFLLTVPLYIRFYLSRKKARSIRRIRLNQVAKQVSDSKTDAFGITTTFDNSDTIEVQLNDELTGLLTNFGLQEAIDEALQAVRNGDARANIILIDVDDMEMLNRANGKPAGDVIICQIADIIKENTPQELTVGRWDGDKFLIVCLGQDREQSKDLACKLRKRIAEETKATCSFGVHQLNPINSFEEAYDRASKCIQEAKFNGKNKVVLFNLRSAITPFTNSAATKLSANQSTNIN